VKLLHFASPTRPRAVCNDGITRCAPIWSRRRASSRFPDDPFSQIDLHGAGQMIEPVGVASEDEDLQWPRGVHGLDQLII
jgi:hypothetical protein